MEVLAASMIMLWFLTMVFGLIWSLSDYKDRTERLVRSLEVGPPVLEIIATDLRQTVQHGFKDGDTFKATEESIGGADTTEVDFVTAVMSRSRVEIDDRYQRAAVCEVGYRMRRSDRYDDLFALYRREDFGVDDKPFEDGKFYKLADRVVEFHLDFFEEDPGNPDSDEALGLPDWDAKEKKALPWGVRITLVMRPPVETNDQGDPIEDVEDVEFVRFVNLPARFDVKPSGS